VNFPRQGDVVMSFEAIIWAWAWLEIGKEMDFLRKEFINIK
jgi:hypothetical protein